MARKKIVGDTNKPTKRGTKKKCLTKREPKETLAGLTNGVSMLKKKIREGKRARAREVMHERGAEKKLNKKNYLG
jgi:hypothetical protein